MTWAGVTAVRKEKTTPRKGKSFFLRGMDTGRLSTLRQAALLRINGLFRGGGRGRGDDDRGEGGGRWGIYWKPKGNVRGARERYDQNILYKHKKIQNKKCFKMLL